MGYYKSWWMGLFTKVNGKKYILFLDKKYLLKNSLQSPKILYLLRILDFWVEVLFLSEKKQKLDKI